MKLEEYYGLKSIFLDYQEYAQIVHIINSRKMPKGKSIIYSHNCVYKVVWIKFDNWKIYDKVDIEESRDLYDKRNKIKNNRCT